MKKNSLKYIKYPVVHELGGIPFLSVKVIRRLKMKEKIKDSLSIIIENAEKKAIEISKEKLSPSEIIQLKDNYEELNDFFSMNFKSKNAAEIGFEEKIKYCLGKYKIESRNISSASNTLILEENFLKGAQRILPLYFFFQEQGINTEGSASKTYFNITQNNKTENSLEQNFIKNETSVTHEHNKTINNHKNYIKPEQTVDNVNKDKYQPDNLAYLMGEDRSKKLKRFFIKENIISENSKLKGKKSPFIRLHHFLFEKSIITPLTKSKDIITAMENEYGEKFDPAVLSRANSAKIPSKEEALRNKMIEYLHNK